MINPVLPFLLISTMLSPFTTNKQESYTITIPTIIDTEQMDSFTINVTQNDLKSNEKLEISFSEDFTLTDRHGKGNIEGHIHSENLIIDRATTGSYNVNFSIDEASAGSYVGNPTITIDIKVIEKEYVLQDGTSINSILSSLSPVSINFSHDDLSNQTALYNLSIDSDAPIYVYSNASNELTITNNTNKPIYANSDMANCFSNLSTLKTINNIDQVNFSKTKDMSNMFSSTRRLATINGLNNIDVSNVTNMTSMFEKNKGITSLDISNWNIQSLDDMTLMFATSNIASFPNIDKLNTGSVTKMDYAFKSNSKIESLTSLANWNVSNVKSFKGMFEACTSLTSLDISGWNTSGAIDLSYFLKGNKKLTTINGLANINLTNAQDISGFFYDDIALTNIDISNWNVSNINNMTSLFEGCTNLVSTGNLANWDLSKATSLSSMFKSATNLTDVGNIANWNITNVSDLSSMFNKCDSLSLSFYNSLNNWNTSNVTNTSYMFSTINWPSDAYLDLSNWNMTSLLTCSNMFLNNSSLGQLTSINISNWNPINCLDYSYMFADNGYLTSIIGIDTLNVSGGNDISYMFYKCTSLPSIDLSNWDVSNISNFDHSFAYTINLTSIGDVNNWNIKQGANLNECFGDGSYLQKNNLTPSWYQ